MSKIILKCNDSSCEVEGGREFFFSDKEQKFYTEKGFTPPKRCWPCRNRRRNQADSPFGAALERARSKDEGMEIFS